MQVWTNTQMTVLKIQEGKICLTTERILYWGFVFNLFQIIGGKQPFIATMRWTTGTGLLTWPCRFGHIVDSRTYPRLYVAQAVTQETVVRLNSIVVPQKDLHAGDGTPPRLLGSGKTSFLTRHEFAHLCSDSTDPSDIPVRYRQSTTVAWSNVVRYRGGEARRGLIRRYFLRLLLNRLCCMWVAN